MRDIYRNAKRRAIYLVLGTDFEGDNCFCIYQNNGAKMHFICKEKIQCKFSACALPVILTSASKSTNSLGYRELREPIRTREVGYHISCFGKY